MKLQNSILNSSPLLRRGARGEAAFLLVTCLIFFFALAACTSSKTENKQPTFTLTKTDKFLFNSFVDCNMAEVWVGDTFRIFPGKYGEDTLWGYSDNLRFGNGANADEAFANKFEDLIMPDMPKNVKPTEDGLHGAVWFETVYQDSKDATGKTLYAVYHNENYPQNFPYNEQTGQGYIYKYWPQGLTGVTSPAAVCRIGIMKSTDGGYSWDNRGIFIEDLQPRMILKPHNTSNTFAGWRGRSIGCSQWRVLCICFMVSMAIPEFTTRLRMIPQRNGAANVLVWRVLNFLI
jgi:hypothetical protein